MMQHFIWVFTFWNSTPLLVSHLQRVKICDQWPQLRPYRRSNSVVGGELFVLANNVCGPLCLVLFCDVVLNVISSFAIILLKKLEVVASDP